MADDDLGRDARMTKYQEFLNRLSTPSEDEEIRSLDYLNRLSTPSEDVEIRSLDYLRHLSRLHEDWENDPACQCCDWAVMELVAMADELRKFQQEMTDVHSGKSA